VRLGALAIVVTVVMVTMIHQVDAMEYEPQNYATPWNISDEIPVLIMSDAGVQPYKLDVVKNSIEFNGASENQTFRSWNNLIDITNSKYNSDIPRLKINDIHNQNYIIIYLKEDAHPKYDGFTELTYNNGKIQKAFITIYNLDELTDSQIEMITRHELGHALGLSHLTGQLSIMNPIIDLQNNLLSMFEMQFLLMVY
jgi:hypothetical protein